MAKTKKTTTAASAELPGQDKLPEASLAWDSLAGPVHAKVFTVAGATSADPAGDQQQLSDEDPPPLPVTLTRDAHGDLVLGLDDGAGAAADDADADADAAAAAAERHEAVLVPPDHRRWYRVLSPLDRGTEGRHQLGDRVQLDEATAAPLLGHTVQLIEDATNNL